MECSSSISNSISAINNTDNILILFNVIILLIVLLMGVALLALDIKNCSSNGMSSNIGQ